MVLRFFSIQVPHPVGIELNETGSFAQVPQAFDVLVKVHQQPAQEPVQARIVRILPDHGVNEVFRLFSGAGVEQAKGKFFGIALVLEIDGDQLFNRSHGQRDPRKRHLA